MHLSLVVQEFFLDWGIHKVHHAWGGNGVGGGARTGKERGLYHASVKSVMARATGMQT